MPWISFVWLPAFRLGQIKAGIASRVRRSRLLVLACKRSSASMHMAVSASLGGGTSVLLGALTPAVATTLAFLALNERPSGLTIGVIVLVTAGVTCASWSGATRRRTCLPVGQQRNKH